MSGRHCGDRRWCKRAAGCVCQCEGCGIARFNEEGERNRMQPILDEERERLEAAVVEAALETDGAYESLRCNMIDGKGLDRELSGRHRDASRRLLIACAALRAFRERESGR